MRFRDLAFLVVSNLRRMKLRLALTSLGVVIGTSAIVLMVSLGIGLQANMTASLGDLGAATNIQVMAGGMVMGGGSGEAAALDDEAIERFAAIEHAEAVLPGMYVYTLQSLQYKKYETYVSPQGVPMDAFEQFGYTLAEGRLPRTDKEIVLGVAVPASFSFVSDSGGAGMGMGGPTAPELDLLGKRLTGVVVTYPTEEQFKADPNAQPKEEKRKFTVVGILEPIDSQTDNSAYVTLDAAIDLNNADKRNIQYESVTVKADSVNTVADVETAISDMGYYTFSARSIQDQLKSVFLVIQGVLGALGGIAMLVAALGIANTMTMSIYERTREIGIMKAVGASNRQIKRVFLGEAAIIGVLGGIGGLLFSGVGAALANLFIQALIAGQTAAAGTGAAETTSFFQIPVWLAAFAIAFAAGVGLLSGVLPAVRAANLDPLTALRHE
jgi:putative ABC transport system permease protein